jgi:TonB-dependent receptor
VADGFDTAGRTSEVVVTGQRATSAIDEKRSATGVVNGLDAAQLQVLPDDTVAEVLTHLPGLSVTSNNDNEQGRNVAQHPAIRGLDSKYNNISFDGLPIATADFVAGGVSSRATPLDILPKALVEGIEVYKTYAPDRNPQAIGGGIALRTHSAFDGGGAPVTQLVAGGGFKSLNSQPYRQDPVDLDADLLVSRQFGADNQSGVVLSLDYQKQADYTTDNATTDSVFYNFYNSAGVAVSKPSLSNGFAVPQQDKSWVIEEVTKKIAATAKFEYRPTDQLAAFATAGFYNSINDSTRNEVIITPGGTLSNQTSRLAMSSLVDNIVRSTAPPIIIRAG